MSKGFLIILLATFCVVTLVTNAPAADVTPVDSSTLLATFVSTPPAALKPVVAKAIKDNPSETRNLTLDLIFYRWAALSIGVDPSIKSLDDIAGALVAASTDRSVIWTASELGPKSWNARPLPTDDNEDLVKAIKEARYALRSALGYASGSPSRSIDSLNSCATTLLNSRLEMSAAFIDARLGERHLYTTRRYRDAESYYDRARPILAAYGLREQVARLYQDLGKLNEDSGLYDEARENYALSAQEWVAAGRGDIAGQQYVNAGLALSRLGKDRAFSVMRIGLDLSRSYVNTPRGNYEAHAKLLLQVASFCLSNGRYDDARALLTEPDLKTKLGDSLLRADSLKMLAAAWKAMGQDPRSREALTERTRILSALAQKGQDAVAKLGDEDLSAVDRLGLLTAVETGAAADNGLERYQQAIDLLQPVVSAYDTLQRTDDKVRALRSLALNQDLLGDRQAGLVSRSQAARIAREDSKYSVAIEILRDIQQSAQESGDTSTQIDALYEARQVAEISNDLRSEADLLFTRGILLISLNKPVDAAKDLETAASISTDQIGDIWSAAGAAVKLAQIRVSQNQPQEAAKVLTDAVKRIEKWADTEQVDPGLEPTHQDTLVSMYNQLVLLQLKSDHKPDALTHLRTASQYTWYDKLCTQLRSSGEPAIPALLESVRQAKRPPEVQKGQPVRIATGWTAVITKIPTFSTIASRSRNANRSVVDAVEIFRERAKLPQNTAIVAYAMDDTDVYVLVATGKTASCWQIYGAADRVVEAVQSFRKSVRSVEKEVSAGMPMPPVRSWSDPKVALMLDPLYTLEETLFEPIKNDLPVTQIKSVVFALPDRLAGVPFHALPQDVKGKPGTVRFLLDDYTVSYIAAGMLSDLVSPATGPISPKKENVAIFPSSTLAGAVYESKSIRTYFPLGKLLPDTTADRFVQACSSAGIVHIATHHNPDPEPTNVEIVLSGAPGGAGTVRLADLMRISNPGLHLAVLSACESIGSTDAEATSTTHVAEAFGLAGFPSFIGGLWKVSDNASTRLMSEFYRILAKSGQKADALRRAQQSMIQSPNREFAHPFYWAGFALYGDPR